MKKYIPRFSGTLHHRVLLDRITIQKLLLFCFSLIVVGADNLQAGKLLYIYSKAIVADSVQAADYKSLFASLGHTTTLIKTNQVLSTNLAQFDLIVVGSSTGTAMGWEGDTATVSYLKNSGKPFLAMGAGGLVLMDYFKNWAGWGQSAVVNSNQVYIANWSNPLFNIPNTISIPADSVLVVYGVSSGGEGLYLGGTVPATVVPLGFVPFMKTYAPIAIEKSRFFYWGFDGTASALTTAGKALIGNVIAMFTFEPKIARIADVPNDNGRQVYVVWNASTKDGDSTKPVTKYSLWRKDSTWWTFAGEVPAKHEFQYAAIVPTIFDSTKTNGSSWSKFKVTAHWQDPLMVVTSPIDSGYSLDNLPPLAPTNASSYSNSKGGWVLSWKPAQGQMNDFKQYAVYRSKIIGGIPAAFTKLGDALDTTFTDNAIENNATYKYRIVSVDYSGNESAPLELQTKVTSVGGMSKVLPDNYSMDQNYPNPFNPSTVIVFTVPQRSFVRLAVYDILGREIALLVNEQNDAGSHSVLWNAERQPSGMYFYRMEAGSFTQTKKLMLMK